MAPQREWFEKDYYKVLGVPETASDKEIGQAYRKLAKQYHPDANPGSEERFKEISAAYDVLGDEAKRKEYDEVRRLGPAGNPFAGMGNPAAGTSGGFRVDDLGDLLGNIFGRGNRPGRHRGSRTGARHRGAARAGPRDQPAPVLPRRGQRDHHHRQRHLRGGVPHLRRERRRPRHRADGVPGVRGEGRDQREPGTLLLQPALPGVRRHRA